MKSLLNEDPKNFQFLCDLIKDSYVADAGSNNTFEIFYSIDNILYLIYLNLKKSIICYDLINNQILSEIKNAVSEGQLSIIHYLDKNNKMDLILSISVHENNIKLYNLKNWECLVNIPNINKDGCIFSASLLKENKQYYIVTSNMKEQGEISPIKIYDFNGKKIKEIKDSNECTYFIDIFFDNKLSTNFIISSNNNYVKSYDYNLNKVYFIYCDNNIEIESINSNDTSNHCEIIIINEEKIIKLIESCWDGNIRIWDFHSGKLLNKIEVSDYGLNPICLFNNNYLFVGGDIESIKLIELNKGIIIKKFIGHYDFIVCIKKIIHPLYGVAILSQGINNEIKLWINKE